MLEFEAVAKMLKMFTIAYLVNADRIVKEVRSVNWDFKLGYLLNLSHFVKPKMLSLYSKIQQDPCSSNLGKGCFQITVENYSAYLKD